MKFDNPHVRTSIKLEFVKRNQPSDRRSSDFIALSRKELCLIRSDGSKLRKPNRNIRGMHILRDVCYHSSAGVHLLASLGKEMSILILTACSLELIGSVPMGQHIVQNLAYMYQSGEVLTGGSMGLRSFLLCSQSSRNGRTRRWILQLTRIYNCSPWVNTLRYHARTNTAVVVWPHAACVDLFNTAHSKRIARLAGALHEQQITDSIFFPRSYYFITSCLGGQIKIWYRDFERGSTGRKLEHANNANLSTYHLHTFRGHRRAVMKLDLHANHTALFLSVSLDGSLRVWNVETLELVRTIETLSGCPLVDLVVLNHGETIVTLTDDGTIMEYISKSNSSEFVLTMAPYTCDDGIIESESADDEVHSLCAGIGISEGSHVDNRGSYELGPTSEGALEALTFDAKDSVLECPALQMASIDRSMVCTLRRLWFRSQTVPGKTDVSTTCIAAVFVHGIFTYCLERSRICRTDIDKEQTRRQSQSSDSERLRTIPIHRQIQGQRIKKNVNSSTLKHKRGFTLVHEIATIEHPSPIPFRRFFTASTSRGRPVLAPHFFLEKARCRERVWATAPIC